jgi:hypothetical protein
VHAILDRLLGDYRPVVAGLENDIDELENEIFGEAHGGLSTDLLADPGGDRVSACNHSRSSPSSRD